MKSRPDFEARYGFVAVMDIKLGKRRSLIKRLADDPVYMEKHGFIKIEKPVNPPPPSEIVLEGSIDFTNVENKNNIFNVMAENDPKFYDKLKVGGLLENGQTILAEKKKRGRPKKQK